MFIYLTQIVATDFEVLHVRHGSGSRVFAINCKGLLVPMLEVHININEHVYVHVL